MTTNRYFHASYYSSCDGSVCAGLEYSTMGNKERLHKNMTFTNDQNLGLVCLEIYLPKPAFTFQCGPARF